MHTKKGAILLIVLIVVLTISLLGATLVSLYYSVLITGQIEFNRAEALYLAEAGIAAAIAILKRDAQSPPVAIVLGEQLKQVVPRTSLGGGHYEVWGNILDQALVSTGESHGVKRTIQLKYSAF